MLPGFDGLEVCRRIQADRPVPVLMLTARDDETDLLVGLAVGADDYLTKPFSMRELTARVHVLLRRMERAAATPAPPAIRLGDIEINEAERRVRRAGVGRAPHPDRVRPAGPPRGRPRTVLPRERLLADVWGWARRERHPHGGQPHQGSAPQAGRRSHPHGARGRLRPGGAAMTAPAGDLAGPGAAPPAGPGPLDQDEARRPAGRLRCGRARLLLVRHRLAPTDHLGHGHRSRACSPRRCSRTA